MQNKKFLYRGHLIVGLVITFLLIGNITYAGNDGMPDISVSPSSYDFGSINVGSSSSPQIFTISNTGTSDLVIDSISITGGELITCAAIGCPVIDPSSFTIQNSSCLGQPIEPLSSCIVDVTFQPLSTGSKKIAALTIQSNDPDTPTLYSGLISGTGLMTDADNDGSLDLWEINNFGDLTTADATTDYDGDCLLDRDEYANSTDPKNADSDSDGMPDGWEVTYELRPLVDDSAWDRDRDGLTNRQEYEERTNPNPKIPDTTTTVTTITAGDIDGNGQDDIIVDYGPGFNLWKRMNNSGRQTRIYGQTAEIVTTGDMDGNGQDDIIVDYGPVVGLWVRMNNDGPQKLLHSLSPEIIACCDMDGNGQDDVIIDFGPEVGLWVLMNNGSTWTWLHSLSPEIIACCDMDGNGQGDVIIDFGPEVGLWVRMNNSSTWTWLHSQSPEIVATGDMDGNGQDDVIVDFGPEVGLWIRMNNSVWNAYYHFHLCVIGSVQTVH